MITLLYIGLTLAMWAVVHLVRMGCRSIVQLCDELNRDQAVGYRLPVDGGQSTVGGRLSPATTQRKCPDWLLVATGRSSRRG